MISPFSSWQSNFDVVPDVGFGHVPARHVAVAIDQFFLTRRHGQIERGDHGRVGDEHPRARQNLLAGVPARRGAIDVALGGAQHREPHERHTENHRERQKQGSAHTSVDLVGGEPCV